MVLQPILAIIILRFLRKSLKTAGLLPKWGRLFMIGTVLLVALMVISITVKDSKYITTWIGHALLFALVYLIFYKKEFRSVKPVVYATLPVMLVYFIDDAVTLVNPGFHKRWENYFDTAGIFAFIWMGAMLFITNRQRKALEKERLKAAEKEKEYKAAEAMKAALEVQVKERTAELTIQKEELQHALDELRSTQSQLIHSEKMASLGELTAGIAHEIQNPLNFVNNFSEVNTELVDELQQELKAGKIDDALAISNDIKDNEQKINHHGKRADAIVKGMLQHSRSSSGQKEPTDINVLADEYLRLAYHGLRARDKTFNAAMKTDYDGSIGLINIMPQDMGRVILNLITNAFYAAPLSPEGGFKDPNYKHEPTVWVSTKKVGDKVLISVKDNGPGIPQKILDKIFQPFFTTKPTGQGTGLGLSLSYDIVKAHGGEIKVETKEGEGANFIISLPINN
jgi:two-component system, NtrC family, sensor kinase